MPFCFTDCGDIVTFPAHLLIDLYLWSFLLESGLNFINGYFSFFSLDRCRCFLSRCEDLQCVHIIIVNHIWCLHNIHLKLITFLWFFNLCSLYTGYKGICIKYHGGSFTNHKIQITRGINQTLPGCRLTKVTACIPFLTVYLWISKPVFTYVLCDFWTHANEKEPWSSIEIPKSWLDAFFQYMLFITNDRVTEHVFDTEVW